MLVNWKVDRVSAVPTDRQSANYLLEGDDYWFFRHFVEKPEVDVLGTSGWLLLDHLERDILHVHVLQGIRAIARMGHYDLVVSHGMTSAVVLAAWRTLTGRGPKHLVFDIGCFNSAAESGRVMRLLQRASRSIDGLIYHTRCQGAYYRRHYPWLADKSRFIRFGTNIDEFAPLSREGTDDQPYLLCVGSVRRDWDTLVKAYAQMDTSVRLRLVGHIDAAYEGIPGIEQLGHIPIDELKAQIQGATLCVLPLPSFAYSFGQMTLLQQMALEKCVVVADVPSVEGYVEDGVTALVYAPQDAQSLRDRLEYALGHPQEMDRIGKQARYYLVESCNEKLMARQVEGFIEEVMTGAAGGATCSARTGQVRACEVPVS